MGVGPPATDVLPGDVDGALLERWLHSLGYNRFEIDRLAMLEIDRLLYAERLQELFQSGFKPRDLRAVERYRRRRRPRSGPGEG